MQKFVCVYMYISRTAEWIGMKFGIHVDYTLDNHIGYFLFEYRVTAVGSWFMIKLKDKMRLGRSPAFTLGGQKSPRGSLQTEDDAEADQENKNVSDVFIRGSRGSR